MTHTASAFIQEYFRIRSDDSAGLNANSGWAAAENVNATIGTGLKFRIRFKVRETAGGSDSTGFKLQVKRNAGSFVDVTTVADIDNVAAEGATSAQYTDGASTSTELLTNTGTYVNGEGLHDNTSGSYSLSSQETELEWCLLIHSFHDVQVQNQTNDTLEFRVVQSNGTAFTGTYTNPTVTISETNKFVGGVFIESPGHIGPYIDGNDNIYTVIEHADHTGDNTIAVIKSTDGGNTWREGNTSRPAVQDLESLCMVQDGDTLHILVQNGAGDSDVTYHQYFTSDHATSPDTWNVKDESVEVISGSASDQETSLAVLSDGSIFALYRKTATNESVYFKIRSTGGSWDASPTEVDTTASVNFLGGMAVKEAGSDKVHIAYKDDTNGDLYRKSWTSGGGLSSRELISNDSAAGVSADEKPVLPLIAYQDGAVEVVMFIYKRSTDDKLYSRTTRDDATLTTEAVASDSAVASHLGGSNQPTASASADGTTVYLFYSDDATNDLYRDSNADEAGWGTDTEEKDAVTVGFIRGNVYVNPSGDTVFGYIYDSSGNGDAGYVWYDEYVISVVSGDSNAALLAKKRQQTYLRM